MSGLAISDRERVSFPSHYPMIRDQGDGQIVREMQKKRGLLEKCGYLLSEKVRPNGKIYNKLLNQSSRESSKLLRVFFQSIKDQGLANSMIYNSYIKTVKSLDQAKETYEEAVRLGIADEVTHNTFMAAASRAGRFDEVQIAYERCKSPDVYTFATYINAARHAKKSDQVTAAYKRAKEASQVNHQVFNAFMTAADEAGKFTEVETAFQEMKQWEKEQRKNPDIVSYNIYIKAADHSREYGKAEEKGNEARQLKITNETTYSVIIATYDHAGEYEKAEAAFAEAIERGQINAVVCSVFMTAAGNAKKFDKVETAFAIGKEENDVVLFNTFITEADRAEKYSRVHHAYNEATDWRIADVVTLTAYITAMGRARRFDLVEAAFERRKQLKTFDVGLYNAFITAAGNAMRFGLVNKAFREACSYGIADDVTYAAIMTAADAAKRYNEVTIAFKELKEKRSQEKRSIGIGVYNTVIAAAGNAGQFQDAHDAFKETLRLKIFDDVTVINFMKIAAHTGHFAEVWAASRVARDIGITHPMIDTLYIVAAGNTGRYEEAYKTFEEGKALGDVVHFNAFISAAGNNGHFEAAKATFEEAKKRGIANAMTYGVFMLAAALTNQHDEVKEVFEGIDSKPITDYVASIYIDILVGQGNFEAATAIFNKHIAIPTHLESGHTAYDLHGFSRGVGRILMQTLHATEEKKTVIIITGQGREGQLNWLKFRSELLSHLEQDAPGSMQEDIPNNQGAFLLTLHADKEPKPKRTKT